MAADPRGDRQDADRRADPAPGAVQSTWFRLAAAVLLVLVTSFVTYYLTRQSMQTQVARQVEARAGPGQCRCSPRASASGSERLGAGYMNARAELDKRFQERLASLPAADRAKVEKNLADLRHAADEISANAQTASVGSAAAGSVDATYQSELQLLANVSDLPTAGSMRTDL